MIIRSTKLSDENKKSVSGLFFSFSALTILCLVMIITGFFLNALYLGISGQQTVADKTVKAIENVVERPEQGKKVSDKLSEISTGISKSLEREFHQAQEKKDYLQIIQIASAAANEFPRSAMPDVYKAQALLKLGRVAQANSTIMESLRRFPRDPSIHLAAAAFFQATQNPVAAEKMLFKTLRLEPASVGAFRGLVATYLNAGLYTLARETALNGLTKIPSDPDLVHALADSLRLSQNYSDAAEKYKQYVLINGQPGPQTYYFLASCLRLSGASAEEISGNYRKSIELKPDFLPAVNDFALHLASINNASEALSLVSELEKYAEEDPVALDTAGMVYFQCNSIEKAEQAFLKARQKALENPEISAHLAGFYLALNDQENYEKFRQDAINKCNGDLILLNRIENEIRKFQK